MTTPESATFTISFTDSNSEDIRAAYYQVQDGWVTFMTEDVTAIATYPAARVTSIKTKVALERTPKEIPDAAVAYAADVIRTVDYPDYQPDLKFARKVLEAAWAHI